MDNKPFQRDYLKEAYEIAAGTSKIRSIKKEHVAAVIAQVKAFENSFAILEERMKELYQREIGKRAAANLPPPPMPPSFRAPAPAVKP